MHNDFLKAGRAGGKVNLHLQVLNRREDNYHNLLSIMAELSISDHLKLESIEVRSGIMGIEVEIVNSGGVYSSLLEEIPADGNLITRGVKSYLERLSLGGYLKFTLEKNIPSGAGLGGGSSDAASALNLVCAALNREPDDILFDAALDTGSDVPFFIHGGVAFAEGRGEILTKISRMAEMPVLLVNNGIHVSTGGAYSSLGRGLKNSYSDSAILEIRGELESVIHTPSEWKRCFVNDFEKPVFAMYPELGRLKDELYGLGALFSLMSGSGSTVYGVFSSESDAKEAADELTRRGNRVFLTKMTQ